MSEPLFDQALANTAAAVEACMKLGGVILKPPGTPTFGFGGAKEPARPPEREA